LRETTSLILLALLGGLSGCASVTSRGVPCFDGWTTDPSGPSTVRRLSRTERADLTQLTPNRQAIVCVHQMPSGELIVISDGRQLETTSVIREGAGYRVVARGAIV